MNTPGVRVRSAVSTDAAEWLRMRQALWPEEGSSYHVEEVRKYFAGQLHMPLEVLIAELGGRPVGFAELNIRPYADDCLTDRVAYLEGWYVDPDARRRGIGRALIEAAEAWGRDQGCTEFGSDALLENLDSAAAHQAVGFTETSRIRCFRKDLGVNRS